MTMLNKLKQYLLDQLNDTAFNPGVPYSEMIAPVAHIHPKPNVELYTRHIPIPVPNHWKESVKQSHNKDVEREIITSVPVGNPIQW